MIMFKLITQEIKLIIRQPFLWCTPLLFFLIVICLFPLSLGPNTHLLRTIAPGIIWIAALLALLMSLGKLFHDDYEEGCLDLFLLSPYPLSHIVCVKIISHWLIFCLPLIVLSPGLGLLLKLSLRQEYALIISLLLGTPVFCLIGTIGAALTIGLKAHGFLFPILTLPFYIPVLIYGTSVVAAAGLGLPLGGYFAILGALALFTLVLSPWLIMAALRIGVQ